MTQFYAVMARLWQYDATAYVESIWEDPADADREVIRREGMQLRRGFSPMGLSFHTKPVSVRLKSVEAVCD